MGLGNLSFLAPKAPHQQVIQPPGAGCGSGCDKKYVQWVPPAVPEIVVHEFMGLPDFSWCATNFLPFHG